MQANKMQLATLLKRPPRYVVSSVLCSWGGFLFGMDTGIIGPVTVMDRFVSSFGESSAVVHGLIVSSILIPAAISSFFGGRVADILGRPKGIAIGAFIFAFGAAIEGAAQHLAMFITGRVIEGIGEGLYLGNIVVYICEISPARNRGKLTCGPQLCITMGLMLGYFSCYGTAEIEHSMAWRLPFILLSALSFAFTFAVTFWLPESPRWLSLRGQSAEAAAAWEVLDVHSADREKLEDEQAAISNGADEAAESLVAGEVLVTTPGQALQRKKDGRFLDVFAKDSRSRLYLAVFLMAAQQLSGVDGVLYYAPLLFRQAGLDGSQATFLASGVSAIVIFVVTIPALIWADHWGRRTTTIVGGVLMSVTMFLIGGLYAGRAVHGDHGAGRWVVIVSIYLFAVFFSLSWAVSIKIFTAESQQKHTRAVATSLAHGSNWIANFLVALTTPVLLAKSSFGAYFLFGGCLILTAIVSFIFMPETMGKSLDEIDKAFQSRAPGMKGLEKTVKSIVQHTMGTLRTPHNS